MKPCAQIRTRTRCFSELDVFGSRGEDPSITCERQRRPFDPTSQQSVPKIAVKPTQTIKIYRPVVYPVELNERRIAKRPLTKK